MDNNFDIQLDRELDKFNIKQYQYLFFERNLFIAPVIFSTYPPELLQIYWQQKLYYTDPIIHFARTSVQPFAWSSVIPYLSSQDHPLLKLAKQYGINDAYTFVVNDSLGNSAFLNLLCDESKGIDIQFFNSHRAELQMLLIDLYNFYLEKTKDREYYRNKAYLLISEKEKQVFSLACSGLKYREIALNLGIAERTVKFHIRKIVDKLGVDTAKQAFLIAKELDII